MAFGAALGLGVDESYMVAAGRVLSLGYYDHPPAAWWLSWGAAHLFGSEAPILVRLPFIALFALSTWLMYRLGTVDRRRARRTVGGGAAEPVAGVRRDHRHVGPAGRPARLRLAGGRTVPGARTDARKPRLVAGTGLCAGLALFSKYSAVLTIAGVAAYLLSSREHRHWLATPKPWLAALVALMVFMPVLVWNAEHGWASFAFQGGRAAGMRFRPFAPWSRSPARRSSCCRGSGCR